jgi:predicted 3-demethylubiquinone-9 3-methyltransferase (glyoxalase superfamily)
MQLQKITPCLWFDKNAEEAMNFYISVFKDGKIISITRYPEGYDEGPMAGMAGKVLTGIFEIHGQRFMCLDGGPIFKFSEAVSFQVECEDQAEVDALWEKLSAVPEAEQCGWVKDKFGLSWQIIPKRLGELMGDPDNAKAKRVTDAMLKMKKIDVAGLEAAANAK